ncbi:hypothetical protein [Streptomyces puniciscabiei]|uniref:hypothetical protein n=1 Tax=Streptomyces puniciscabiei TaxID=164348 RepID=UPI000A63B286|nr:hypothetical protein [Streptomyces puniciscabiei]
MLVSVTQEVLSCEVGYSMVEVLITVIPCQPGPEADLRGGRPCAADPLSGGRAGALALAPCAVLPDRQRHGTGVTAINAVLDTACARGENLMNHDVAGVLRGSSSNARSTQRELVDAQAPT